ncbi:hypothetical protein DFR67_1233 [Williamsia limnetica]|uniref:Uncharacterized protein n=1 Tax=Williamsia limnetica TaxID=882452 RepID=A0A318RM66_WILLI|nr:hypothetical protein [Williamsia limnetica]PYE12280.1 hypothetical protein DFR67_1233 [Williamsia limnetica]
MRKLIASAALSCAVAAGIIAGAPLAAASPPGPSPACTLSGYYPLIAGYYQIDPSGHSTDPTLVAIRSGIDTLGKTFCNVR